MPVDANVERLSKILGYDPARNTPDSSVLQLAMEELNKERAESLKGDAKKLLTEAIALRKQRDQLERTFNAEIKKIDKGLGNFLNRIEAMASGRPAPDESENKDKEKEEVQAS